MCGRTEGAGHEGNHALHVWQDGMEALVDNIRIKSAQADCLIDYGPPILDHIFSECLQLPVLLIKSQITVRLKLLPPGEQILNRSQGT